MSLTSGLASPRTPLRLFLDREMSAGPGPLRQTFLASLTRAPIVLPGPGVGTEAGTVGTAIDQRLRLAFTAASPVDAATAIGVLEAGGFPVPPLAAAMSDVGKQLLNLLTETVDQFRLDDRAHPLPRAQEEEEHLARLLLAAAWYAVAARTMIGFVHTPLFQAVADDPDAFSLGRLLALPNEDMVADVVAQVFRAAQGDLVGLRAGTAAADCVGGPTFPEVNITADADLVVDGLLLEFKSSRHVKVLPQRTIWQLLGYLLLDHADRYRVDAVGVVQTRTGRLITWPVDTFLELLGARRRDLTELREVFAELLTNCPADLIPYETRKEAVTHGLLTRLAHPTPPGHCWVCAQPLPSLRGSRKRAYCSAWCRQRCDYHRKRGWLQPAPNLNGTTSVPSTAAPPPALQAPPAHGPSGPAFAGPAAGP
ncbi:hypothetical protein ACFWEV_34885 [Streptomyces bacillaris]|uniref:hypothetical protein n=1 Tax=Streptomyces bacillaris TaxID=68179 RepID=UPI0036475852